MSALDEGANYGPGEDPEAIHHEARMALHHWDRVAAAALGIAAMPMVFIVAELESIGAQIASESPALRLLRREVFR